MALKPKLSEFVVRKPRRVKNVPSVEFKLKQIKRILNLQSKEIGVSNIHCYNSKHWKSIVVCGLICSTKCVNFISYRWLCVSGGKCGNLEKCKKKDYWCKWVSPKLKIVDNYLELYAKWREMKKLSAGG